MITYNDIYEAKRHLAVSFRNFPLIAVKWHFLISFNGYPNAASDGGLK